MCRRRICAVARTLIRVFAVFAVLTGVLLVHGFGGNHDLNGGVATPEIVQTSVHGTTDTAPSLSAHDHADGRHAHAAAHAAGAHAAPADEASGAAGDHGGHGDAHTCLALLMGSALVLAGLAARLRAGRQSNVAPGSVALLRSRVLVLARASSPDLSLLCVSRT